MTTGDHCIIHCIIELYSTKDTVQKLFYIHYMRLRGKCPFVNILHIFGTPIRKYTTGGLLVGGIISLSTFLAWMHVYFISFDPINTVLCQRVFYFNLFHKILMLSSTIICSPDCFSKSLLGLGSNIILHQHCCVHTVHTVLIESAHKKPSIFLDWLYLLSYSWPYSGWAF